jgi:hypothetical protein
MYNQPTQCHNCIYAIWETEDPEVGIFEYCGCEAPEDMMETEQEEIPKQLSILLSQLLLVTADFNRCPRFERKRPRSITKPEPADEWISADTPPTEPGEYIVAYESWNGEKKTGKFTLEEGASNVDSYSIITHWRKYPEPPTSD